MIDTENKRRSATAFLMITVFPVSDGVIDKGDRVHATAVYRGGFDGLSNLRRLLKLFGVGR